MLDAKGYEIRYVPRTGTGRARFKVYTPAGEFMREFRHEDAAHGAADRHFRELNEVITLRPCMNFDNCGTEFESTWKGHRLCDKCKTKTGGLI